MHYSILDAKNNGCKIISVDKNFVVFSCPNNHYVVRTNKKFDEIGFIYPECLNISIIKRQTYDLNYDRSILMLAEPSLSHINDIYKAKEYFALYGCTLLENIFKNYYTPMAFICECGNIDYVSLSAFSNGVRCNVCVVIRNKVKPVELMIKRRDIYGYKEWQTSVLLRDNYQCQFCNSTKKLCTHHINDYDNFPDQRINIDNGITLYHTKIDGFSTREKFCEYVRHMLYNVILV